jgi:hypothetical protein
MRRDNGVPDKRFARCSRAAHVLSLVGMLLWIACIDDPHLPPQQSVGPPTAPPSTPTPPTTPSQGTGTLRVAVVTAGAEVAPYGYALMVDSAIVSMIAPNAVTTLDVPPGPHDVRLGGVPLDCTGDGRAVRSVTVTTGRETLESFAIACRTPEAPPPDTLPTVRISVKVVTTGVDIDAHGYFVGFERQALGATTYRTGRQIAANDSIVLMLPTGTYSVRLFDLASNCTASQEFDGFEARSADVRVNFTVTCAAIPERQGFQITTVTTGTNPDTDGYAVSIVNDLDMDPEEFEWSGTVGANGSVTVPRIRTGYFLVFLSGVAKNCIVVPSALLPGWVGPDTMSSVEFQVLCFPPVGSSP